MLKSSSNVPFHSLFHSKKKTPKYFIGIKAGKLRTYCHLYKNLHKIILDKKKQFGNV